MPARSNAAAALEEPLKLVSAEALDRAAAHLAPVPPIEDDRWQGLWPDRDGSQPTPRRASFQGAGRRDVTGQA